MLDGVFFLFHYRRLAAGIIEESLRAFLGVFLMTRSREPNGGSLLFFITVFRRLDLQHDFCHVKKLVHDILVFILDDSPQLVSSSYILLLKHNLERQQNVRR